MRTDLQRQASGTLDERPELARMLDHLREGDTLAVWRLDRLGRSLHHLVDTISGLVEHGVARRRPADVRLRSAHDRRRRLDDVRAAERLGQRESDR